MYFCIYDAFYSQNPQQHVSAGIPATPNGDSLMKKYKNTNVVNRVTTTL
jgi:hypothetical protein